MFNSLPSTHQIKIVQQQAANRLGLLMGVNMGVLTLFARLECIKMLRENAALEIQLGFVSNCTYSPTFISLVQTQIHIH